MEDGAHYWFGSAREQSVAVLEALRTYRAAEAAMRRRTRDSMRMGENDLLALRYLLKADGQGRTVGPKELSEYLGISTASVTSLVDRLERSGHVERRPSPFDRRALILVPTVSTDTEVRQTLGEMHERMIAVAQGLTPEGAGTVIEFLNAMREAVDMIDQHGPAVHDQNG